MNVILPTAAAVLLSVTGAVWLVLRRLARARSAAKADIAWLREFSAARYRPMERLLAHEDYDFLSAQPSFRPAICRRLQAERRRIFRAYVRAVSQDFGRLMAAGHAMVALAAEDRPGLALVLLRRRLAFNCALLAVRWRLALSAIAIGQVGVRPLIDALDGLRRDLKPLAESAPVRAA